MHRIWIYRPRKPVNRTFFTGHGTDHPVDPNKEKNPDPLCLKGLRMRVWLFAGHVPRAGEGEEGQQGQ